MSNAVCSAFGSDLTGKLLSVEEIHGSDGHFVLSCLMAQDCFATCLLALHNSVGHYINVSIKLGSSLNSRREKNLLQTIEPLKQMFDPSRDHTEYVKQLLTEIRAKLMSLDEHSDQLLLVVDDLSAFLDMGISLRDTLAFLQYCRDMVDQFPKLTVAILTHVIESDEEVSLLASSLAHAADVRAVVSGLPTGSSRAVSGSLDVYDKASRHSHHWGQQNKYHFKLLDRQVQLFAPGTSQL